MTHEEIVEFVQNNARYYDDGSLEPYAVMYEGKFIWAESPGNLVTNLLELNQLTKIENQGVAK